MNYNHICLAGNLTKDPELRYLPSGKAVCNLRMAYSEKYRTAQGEQKEEVLFIDACIFGKPAEAASTYLKKGRNVFVEGKLRVRDWVNKDGQKRKAIEIIATRWLFAGGAAPQHGAAPAPAGKPWPTKDTTNGTTEDPAAPAEPVDEPMPSLADEYEGGS